MKAADDIWRGTRECEWVKSRGWLQVRGHAPTAGWTTESIAIDFSLFTTARVYPDSRRAILRFCQRLISLSHNYLGFKSGPDK